MLLDNPFVVYCVGLLLGFWVGYYAGSRSAVRIVRRR